MSRRVADVLIATGFVLYVFALPHELAGDDGARFDALRELVDGHRLSSGRYSLVGPLFATPLYLAGKIMFDERWWISRYNVFLLAAAIFAMRRMRRVRAATSLSDRFALILMATSLVPNALRGFGAETFTAVAVAAGILLLQTQPIAAGCVLILATVNTPGILLGTTLVIVTQAVGERRVRWLLVPIGAVALMLIENRLRRDGWLVSGYDGDRGFRSLLPYSGLPGFSYPMWFGLLSLIFSFGKGLLFYVPGVFAPARPPVVAGSIDWRRFHAISIWFVIGLLIVYSKWWAWYGGWSWGPRFFLFACVPAAIALASRLDDATASTTSRLITLGVLAVSAWVAIDGAVYALNGSDLCFTDNYAFEALCWYVPEFSPLWRPFVTTLDMSVRHAIVAAYCAIVCGYVAAPAARGLFRRAALSRGIAGTAR